MHLNAHVDGSTFMSACRSTTDHASIFSKVSTSTHAASQYSSAKGPFIACIQVGLSAWFVRDLACSIMGWSQLITRLSIVPSKPQSRAAKWTNRLMSLCRSASGVGTSHCSWLALKFASCSLRRKIRALYSCFLRQSRADQGGYLVPTVQQNFSLLFLMYSSFFI